MVTMAIAFIADASLLASSAIRTCILLSPCAATLNACECQFTRLLHAPRTKSYKSNLVLDPGIARFGPLEQALQKPDLEREPPFHRVPAAVLAAAANRLDVRAKALVMLPHGVERPYGYVQGLPDVHPVSGNLVQEEEVGLVGPPLSRISLSDSEEAKKSGSQLPTG